MSKEVDIVESYRNWTPSIDVVTTVKVLLDNIPERYINGLQTIVLTNIDALNHHRRNGTTRSRGKNVKIISCQGLYHQAVTGQAAWIELFVDNILEGVPTFILRFAVGREIQFASVLFHEVGHHVHATQVPEYREREDVANLWRRKIARFYFRRRYWYLIPFAVIIKYIVRPLINLKRKQRQPA